MAAGGQDRHLAGRTLLQRPGKTRRAGLVTKNRISHNPAATRAAHGNESGQGLGLEVSRV